MNPGNITLDYPLLTHVAQDIEYLGLSQYTLAQEVGESQPRISRTLAGRGSLLTLRRIVAYLATRTEFPDFQRQDLVDEYVCLTGDLRVFDAISPGLRPEVEDFIHRMTEELVR